MLFTKYENYIMVYRSFCFPYSKSKRYYCCDLIFLFDDLAMVLLSLELTRGEIEPSHIVIEPTYVRLN